MFGVCVHTFLNVRDVSSRRSECMDLELRRWIHAVSITSVIVVCNKFITAWLLQSSECLETKTVVITNLVRYEKVVGQTHWDAHNSHLLAQH